MYVKEIKKTKLVLSLKLKQYECKIHVGQIVDGIVTDCINNESLIVEIDNEDAIAILPLAHLNDNVEYAKYLLGNKSGNFRIQRNKIIFFRKT